MKLMNKTAAFAALVAGSLLAGGVAVQAQDSTPSTNAPAVGASTGGVTPSVAPRQRSSQAYFNHISTALALTDEEKTNVLAALKEQQQQMQAIRSDTSLTPQDKRAQLKQLRTDLNTKMQSILTPDQYTKWLTLAPGRRRPTPPPAAPADSSTPATTAPTPPPQ
jgi:periplasmic protein CpxP/Spy